MSSTPPPPAASSAGSGNLGKIRTPLGVIGLSIITCGIYTLYWYYKTYEETKDYSGEGLGGLVGLLLAIFCLIVNWFVLPAEIGNLYEQDGKDKPISGMTGFWNLIPLIGTIIWLFKVQGHLSEFWESKGQTKE